MNNIIVTVSGYTGTGKSQIMLKIYDALVAAGLKVNACGNDFDIETERPFTMPEGNLSITLVEQNIIRNVS